MENQNLPMRKSTILSRVRIPVAIALVICLFTPWLSGCGGPYPGAYVIFTRVANPLMITEAISGDGTSSSGIFGFFLSFILLFLSVISFLLYPILNLNQISSVKDSTPWRIGSFIGSILCLVLVYASLLSDKTTDRLLWGYWLTWLVLLAAGIVEVLDRLKLPLQIDDPPQRDRFLIGIVSVTVALVVVAFAIWLLRPAPTPTARPIPTAPPFDVVREYRYAGEEAARKGNYDEAIASFSKAIELDFMNHDLMNAYSYLERGDAYYQKGSYDQAIADYNKLIQLNPNFQGAYHYRAKAYSKKGAYDQALADFNKAIQLDPVYAEAYRDRGVFYREQGLVAQAIADFQKYLTLAQQRPAADRAQVEQWLRELQAQ